MNWLCFQLHIFYHCFEWVVVSHFDVVSQHLRGNTLWQNFFLFFVQGGGWVSAQNIFWNLSLQNYQWMDCLKATGAYVLKVKSEQGCPGVWGVTHLFDNSRITLIATGEIAVTVTNQSCRMGFRVANRSYPYLDPGLKIVFGLPTANQWTILTLVLPKACKSQLMKSMTK